MKSLKILGTTLSLFLLLGTAVPGYAQQGDKQGDSEKQDKGEKQGKSGKQDKGQSQAKPEKQQGQQQQKAQPQARPEQQQPRAQQQQDRNKEQQAQKQRQQQDQGKQQHAQVQQQQQQRARLQQTATPAQQREQQGAWQQHRARSNWQSEHRTWQQRGGYNGYRIDDAYFNNYYGRSHRFLCQSFGNKLDAFEKGAVGVLILRRVHRLLSKQQRSPVRRYAQNCGTACICRITQRSAAGVISTT